MFKTIQECRLDLVAATMGFDPQGSEDGFDLDDFFPCRAARVSFSNEGKTGESREKDVKLMKYLADHKHMTPFEYQHATFLIECPLFIRSQIHRHRAFSYNEISRRYTDENLEFWIPDKFRGQAKNNKQGSEGELDPSNFCCFLGWSKDKADIPRPRGVRNGQDGFELFKWGCYTAWHNYLAMIESGVCREQSRALLPQALMTKFYMGGNLRSWAHFIELRRDKHAQFEVQVIAERVAEELRKLWPESCKALGI